MLGFTLVWWGAIRTSPAEGSDLAGRSSFVSTRVAPDRAVQTPSPQPVAVAVRAVLAQVYVDPIFGNSQAAIRFHCPLLFDMQAQQVKRAVMDAAVAVE
jgi:hypothetical protein